MYSSIPNGYFTEGWIENDVWMGHKVKDDLTWLLVRGLTYDFLLREWRRHEFDRIFIHKIDRKLIAYDDEILDQNYQTSWWCFKAFLCSVNYPIGQDKVKQQWCITFSSDDDGARQFSISKNSSGLVRKIL